MIKGNKQFELLYEVRDRIPLKQQIKNLFWRYFLVQYEFGNKKVMKARKNGKDTQ